MRKSSQQMVEQFENRRKLIEKVMGKNKNRNSTCSQQASTTKRLQRKAYEKYMCSQQAPTAKQLH